MGLGAHHACGFQTLLVVQPAGDELESDEVLGTWQSGSKLQDFTTYALMVQCTLAAKGVQITASFDPQVIEQWQVEDARPAQLRHAAARGSRLTGNGRRHRHAHAWGQAKAVGVERQSAASD